MSQFHAQAYGPVFAGLLETDRRRPLDAGRPNEAAHSALQALSVESAFAHTRILDNDMAGCCISAAWLLHDYLDESHKISQEIETPMGSFWHGIMHRREGDFSNAKYWFRRVGQHPVLEALGQRAGEMAAARGEEQAAKKLITSGIWDAFAFVDQCEFVVGGQVGPLDLCLDMQQAEWEHLFDHCYREAVGA
jgi:hypothetical protein